MAGGYVVRRRNYSPYTKRFYTPTKKVVYKRGARRAPATQRMFRAGYDRVGGYYGKYNRQSSGVLAIKELKFHDIVVNESNVSIGGQITDSLNHIAQGTGESQRDGRRCTLQSIEIRWRVSSNSANLSAVQTPGDSLRMIVFLDKQCNGTTAAVTDILESGTIHSFYNLANVERFSILCDKLESVMYKAITSETNDTVTQCNVHQEKYWKKSIKIPLEFSATDGLITEIRSNNIGLLLISVNGVIRLTSTFRLRFTG